jgi:hypothetical protein
MPVSVIFVALSVPLSHHPSVHIKMAHKLKGLVSPKDPRSASKLLSPLVEVENYLPYFNCNPCLVCNRLAP